MIYGFIREHSNQFTVKKMCQVLNISRSGYYDCLEREVGQRQLENEELKLKIAKIYWQNKGCYESPRIHK